MLSSSPSHEVVEAAAVQVPPGKAPKVTSFIKRWVIRFTYLYIASIVAAWLLLRFTADDWWVGTLLLFGPRWVAATPLVLFVPLALWVRTWRTAVGLAFAIVMIAGPVTGGVVSPNTWRTDARNHGHIRVLTCNTDGPALNRRSLAALIAQTQPDIVALQESMFLPAAEVFPKGWHVSEGPGGLMLASRFPIENSVYLGERELGMPGDLGRYKLETPLGELTFINVHLPTPRVGFELIVSKNKAAIGVLRNQISSRDLASAKARAWMGETGPSVFVAGDFNMPVESAIYRRHWSDLGNAFDDAGWGWGWTKQTRRFGVRIDHVLAGKAWRCRKAWVGPDVGSDHLPLIADFDVREE